MGWTVAEAARVIPASQHGVSFSEVAPHLALVAVTVLVYLPAVTGGLLWDDDAHITRPALQSLNGLWRIWFKLGSTQQYYPLLHSAFWLEHRLWGDWMAGYHLVNIFLRAASACPVVHLARRVCLPGAWLAGFVFALHRCAWKPWRGFQSRSACSPGYCAWGPHSCT